MTAVSTHEQEADGDPTAGSWVLGRRPGLDGLRAVAVGAVVLRHSPYHVQGGYLGVELFFVVSGFLITSLLVEEHDQTGRIDLRAFYTRRVLRLGPPLVLFLLAVSAYGVFVDHEPATTGLFVVVTLTYLANWAVATNQLAVSNIQIIGGVAWSLAVEEQFYLLWPAILRRALGTRRPMRWVVGVIAMGVAFRLALVAAGQLTMAYYLLFPRLDQLVAGAALALALHRGWRPSARWVRATGPLLVGFAVLVASVRGAGYSAPGLLVRSPLTTLVGLGLLLAALPGATRGSARVLRSRPFVLVGRWSYSIYLFHRLIFESIAHVAPRLGPGPQFVLGLAATVAVSALVRVAVERPAQRLKHRFDRVPVSPSS